MSSTFESHVRQLRVRLDAAERRGIYLERELATAQRHIAGSKNAEEMRVLTEENEHLSRQLEGLRCALRGGGPPPPSMETVKEETKDEDPRITALKESHGADLSALVARVQSGEEALSAAKDEARRKGEKIQRLENEVTKLVGEAVTVKVPESAIPGTSRIVVPCGNGEARRIRIPGDAMPGSTLLLTPRELDAQAILDAAHEISRLKATLEETASQLGSATDRSRNLDRVLDSVRAEAAAASAGRNLALARAEKAESRANVSETHLSASHQSLSSSRSAILEKSKALEAANVAGQAALAAIPRMAADAENVQKAALKDYETRLKAHKNQTNNLVKDLRIQLKREKDAGAQRDKQHQKQIDDLNHKVSQQIQHAREHDDAAGAETKKAECELCSLLARRLEELLSENVLGREKIAFLEASVRDLNAELVQMRDESFKKGQFDVGV